MNRGLIYVADIDGNRQFFKNMRLAADWIWSELLKEGNEEATAKLYRQSDGSKFVLMQTYHAQGNPKKD
jgi:hypothetical protein